MTPDKSFWAAHCAAFSDGHLLRFIDATDRLRDRYMAAREVAEAEALRRNLIKEKAPVAGGQSTQWRKP
jgi:hypothetical protein